MAKPTQIDWSDLLAGPFTWSKQEITAPWTMVCENLAGMSHVKITAKGDWALPHHAPAKLGPDGGPAPVSNAVLPELAREPFGALIGKIGGASAGFMPLPAPAAAPLTGAAAAWPPQIDQPFLIGTSCIFAAPSNMIGPLYIGFNCITRPICVETLEITVQGAILSP